MKNSLPWWMRGMMRSQPCRWYQRRKQQGTYDDYKDVDALMQPVDAWANKVVEALERIFPTQLEAHLFLDPEIAFGRWAATTSIRVPWGRCRYFVRGLNRIRLQSLPEYTDLPLDARLYVEDIDSFTSPRCQSRYRHGLLNNGYLDRRRTRFNWPLREYYPFHSTRPTGRWVEWLIYVKPPYHGTPTRNSLHAERQRLQSTTMESNTAAKRWPDFASLPTPQRRCSWSSS